MKLIIIKYLNWANLSVKDSCIINKDVLFLFKFIKEISIEFSCFNNKSGGDTEI